MVNTRQVKDRRKLRFNSVNEALAEVDRLVAAERGGKLKRLGNWSLGQVLGHLAFWADASFDGYPNMKRPPWFLRPLVPIFLKKMMRDGFPAGFRLPGAAEGTYGTDEMSTELGAAKARAALQRVSIKAPTHANPGMGRVYTHEESVALTLRHAELHLGFFVVEG